MHASSVFLVINGIVHHAVLKCAGARSHWATLQTIIIGTARLAEFADEGL